MTLTDVTGSRRVVSGHGFNVPGNTAQRVGDGVLDVRLAVELVVVAEWIIDPPLGTLKKKVQWANKKVSDVAKILCECAILRGMMRTLVRWLEQLFGAMGLVRVALDRSTGAAAVRSSYGFHASHPRIPVRVRR